LSAFPSSSVPIRLANVAICEAKSLLARLSIISSSCFESFFKLSGIRRSIISATSGSVSPPPSEASLDKASLKPSIKMSAPISAISMSIISVCAAWAVSAGVPGSFITASNLAITSSLVSVLLITALIKASDTTPELTPDFSSNADASSFLSFAGSG